MRYFLFGLQRSGTNFLERTMTKNFNSSRTNSTHKGNCWKHSLDLPSGYNKTVPTLVIYKNPYTWVESLCLRNCVDWEKTQTKFPVTEGPVKLRLGPKHFNVVQLAKTYKYWCDTWVLSDLPNRYIIRYEDLLHQDRFDYILSELSKILQEKKKDSWHVPPKGAVPQSKNYTAARELYYKEMKPTELKEFHIAAIRDIIGPDYMEKLRY